MSEYERMVAAAKLVRNRCMKRMETDVENGHIPPSYDLTDFSDRTLIYGMRKHFFYNYGSEKEDHENFNLGSCMTFDVSVPAYRFFRFRNMYKELVSVCEECGMKGYHLKNTPAEVVVESVVSVLCCNSKYYRKFVGEKIGCRICLFMYRGKNTDHL